MNSMCGTAAPGCATFTSVLTLPPRLRRIGKQKGVPMSFQCPKCGRPVYNHHREDCEFCGEPLPPNAHLSPERQARIDHLKSAEAKRYAKQKEAPHSYLDTSISVPYTG